MPVATCRRVGPGSASFVSANAAVGPRSVALPDGASGERRRVADDADLSLMETLFSEFHHRDTEDTEA